MIVIEPHSNSSRSIFATITKAGAVRVNANKTIVVDLEFILVNVSYIRVFPAIMIGLSVGTQVDEPLGILSGLANLKPSMVIYLVLVFHVLIHGKPDLGTHPGKEPFCLCSSPETTVGIPIELVVVLFVYVGDELSHTKVVLLDEVHSFEKNIKSCCMSYKFVEK